MKIAYYLNEGRKLNLYCRINDGKERITFSMGYSVSPAHWDSVKEELDFDDIHHLTLYRFKQYLIDQYNKLESEGYTDILQHLKKDAVAIIEKDGIEGIDRKLFNENYQQYNIPNLDKFIAAFEKFSSLSRNEFKVEIIDSYIHCHTKDKKYEVNTYDSIIHELRSFLRRRSYDEIAMTYSSIWNEVYIDGGILKSDFMPVMLSEWEIYWKNEILNSEDEEIKNNVKKGMEASWRQFQVFMECYENTTTPILLAESLDSLTLYPLFILTMLRIFNEESCLLEYCEIYFSDWEGISLDEEDEDTFWIKDVTAEY